MRQHFKFLMELSNPSMVLTSMFFLKSIFYIFPSKMKILLNNTMLHVSIYYITSCTYVHYLRLSEGCLQLETCSIFVFNKIVVFVGNA